MNRRGVMRALAWSVAAATSVTCVYPMQVQANTITNFDVRKKVIALSGILGVTGDLTRKVTRAQFARMLVLASAYRSVLTTKSNVSVFADVKSGNEYASAIRLCAENGWMNGFLGGNFYPDQYVTLNEAAKGAEYLLGYTATDFSGDQFNKRMAKYASLDLNKNISYSDPTSVMTVTDCINLFYNLMVCYKKDTTTYYATVLDATVDSDTKEVNALAMADNTLKGPKAVSSKSQLESAVPFDLNDANIYLNGDAVEADALRSAASSLLVIYYSSITKSVWGYNVDSDADKRVVQGTIQTITYKSTSTLVPSAVTLDDGTEYTIESSDMQFAFSIYGTLHVGDQVVLIYQTSSTTSSTTSSDSSDSSDTTTGGTVIDYVEE